MKYIIGNEFQSNNHNRYNYCNFTGALERKFFQAVKDGDKREQLKLLHNIAFDVFEKDVNSGNNFLHVVCIENSEAFFNKAKRLLNYNKDKIQSIVSEKNKDDKKPLDYLKNDGFKAFLISLLPQKTEENDTTVEGEPKVVNITKENTPPAIPNNENLVGNEISEDIPIDENIFDDPDLDDSPLRKEAGLSSLLGLDNIKKVFENDIVIPLKNNKNVLTNGFLLHGFSGNGKTFAVEKLAEELGREIVPVTTAISYIKQQEELNAKEKIKDFINTSIIKIDSEVIRELDFVAQYLKKHFKDTQEQGFVFIDEIKKAFSLNPFNTNTYNVKATQNIENSAKNGMVLLATTRELNDIDEQILNTLRFERILETKAPTTKIIYEFVVAKVPHLAPEEAKILAKKLNGFSYNDITRIFERVLNQSSEASFYAFDQAISEHAETYGITDLSDEGTTSAYDTFLKRNSFSANDPKSLNDVLGMDEIKTKLKKVFNPIKKHGIFKKYFAENKVVKPNGILLYGPPGCGKTFIMTAIAGETKLPLYQLKLSDIGSSYVNETEKNIKKVFDQLRKKYKETGEASILFCDECDSLFAKNSKDNSVQNSQTVLNTFKEEMNNAGDDGIFVVAATNEKDNLNDAIIRDGRFDTKVEIGYPDDKARIALIASALRAPILKHHCSDEKIFELANLTKGFSSASISTVFRTLKYELTNSIPEEITTEELVEEFLKAHPIEFDTIKNAIENKREEINKTNLKQRRTTNIEWQAKTSHYDEFLQRTYYNDSDPKSLDDVVGMESVKDQIRESVLVPLNPFLSKAFKERGASISSSILLHGPGGVGKTFIIMAAAAESKVPLYEMKMSEISSKYVNETSNNVQKVFDQLKRKYKETGEASILFLDECDSILGKVGDTEQGGNKERQQTLNCLKEELANSLKNGIVVVAATNNYEDLDSNVIRSGRFSSHIKIGYPDKQARMAYIRVLLKNNRNFSDSFYKDEAFVTDLGERTKGMSNADIKESINSAVMKSNSNLIKKFFAMQKKNLIKPDTVLEFDPIKKEDIISCINRKMEEVKMLRSYDEYPID